MLLFGVSCHGVYWNMVEYVDVWTNWSWNTVSLNSGTFNFLCVRKSWPFLLLIAVYRVMVTAEKQTCSLDLNMRVHTAPSSDWLLHDITGSHITNGWMPTVFCLFVCLQGSCDRTLTHVFSLLRKGPLMLPLHSLLVYVTHQTISNEEAQCVFTL